MTFLDKELVIKLRNKINESSIFSDEPSLKDNYDLICSVLDRLYTSVDYLNNHSECPDTEHDFLVFMMYSSMVKDASQQLADVLKITYPFKGDDKVENFMFFKEFCMKKPLNLDEKNVPTDDKFFEYFRSLAFAHPFETSRASFLRKNNKEIHYSPFVLVNDKIFSSFDDIKDAVGVRAYTNRAEGWASILDIKVSFASLKNFIVSRYNFLQEVIKWADEQIDNFLKIWKLRKVNTNLPNKQILEDIIEILRIRHQSTYEIQDVLEYLECDVTLESNNESIEKFRSMITSHIPEICDAVDNFNYNFIYDIIHTKIKVTPEGNVDSMTNYRLEKIFSYLVNDDDRDDNVLWGLNMVEQFSHDFAKDYVTIQPNNMSFLEIKLLVRTACYLKMMQIEK